MISANVPRLTRSDVSHLVIATALRTLQSERLGQHDDWGQSESHDSLESSRPDSNFLNKMHPRSFLTGQ
ncbi:hypothetical protein BDR06DRAFT_951968 [Suillus hirtellus]|nr:hypothetical protein BDR06DRAFT_951968 [Suillus hirtellus]